MSINRIVSKSSYGNIDPNLIPTYIDLFVELLDKTHRQVSMRGNVLLGKLLPNDARSTLDLDVTCVNTTIYYEVIVPCFNDFFEQLRKYYPDLICEIRDSDGTHPGGFKVKSSDGQVLYSVDIAVSILFYFHYIDYSFNGISILGSTIEKILADKCCATLSKEKFRHLKDFYDIYIILNSPLKYDLGIVAKLMEQKVGKDNLTILFEDLSFSDEALDKFHKAWSTFKVFSCTTNKELVKPNTNKVISKVYSLYSKLLKVIF